MIKQLVLMLVLLSIAAVSSAAVAETPKDKGREVIKLKMGDMELPFKHWKHQKSVNGECFHCHNTKIGKIDNWGKDTAHKVCIACHELEDKGPVTCRQCHGKSAQN
jgi:predicted CXXCH cytochrome family protein